MTNLTEEEIQGAIWPPAQVLYIHAMLFNIRAALGSMELAADAMGLTPGSEKPESIDRDFVLNHLQNAIIHAAAVSRHFWPTKGKTPAARKAEARGVFLRRRLGVDDSSALANRRLRNAIEHFDERLDEYLAKGIVGYVIPHYVGPTLDNTGVPGHLFRAFYTDTLIFEVIGERYQIPPLIDELQRLEELLDAVDRGGGNLHRTESSAAGGTK